MHKNYTHKYIFSAIVQLIGGIMFIMPIVGGSLYIERPLWANPFLYESGMVFFFVGAAVLLCGFVYGAFYMSKEALKRHAQTCTMTFVLPDAEAEYLMAAHGPRFWCTLQSFKEKLFYMIDETDVNERFKTPEECADYIYDMLIEEAQDRNVDWNEIP
ncbi:MAG: hypothetical protein GF334_08480 [Candidatus Altiarchaeales archaeon]|nr:hypothetical protein [Candidatus Altiarchaeales archaeon]